VKTKRLLIALSMFASLAQAAPPMPTPAPPELGVKAYVLVDFDTGKVLAEKDATMRAEPASLTKIMTVYAVGDALRGGHIKLEDTPTVSEYAWKQEGSRMFIDVNTPVSVDELLHGHHPVGQ